MVCAQCLERHLLNSNFLYNPDIREGVLVDFGLAEVSRAWIYGVSRINLTNEQARRRGLQWYMPLYLLPFGPP